MHISYEKMTEEYYMQLILFHSKKEEEDTSFNLMVDMSKMSVSFYPDKRMSIPDNIKKINIDVIQLKNEFFQENLSMLQRLLIVVSNKEKVPDVNIRIYSQHYAYFQKEINSALYCDSSDGFGDYNVHISVTKLIVVIALKKIVGSRVSGIVHKTYFYLKKLCH